MYIKGDKMSSQSRLTAVTEKRMRKRFKRIGKISRAFPSMRYLKCFYFTLCRERTPMILPHELIKKFGSLNSVLNASVEELSSVKGHGRNALQTHFYFSESL